MSEEQDAINKLSVFKNICMEMYESSSLCEFTNSGKVIYGQGYGKVILMVLKTKHRYLLNMNGLTLEEVGFLFETSRERIRQMEEDILGTKPARKESKKKSKVGKLRTPSVIGEFETSKDKIEFMQELKDTMRIMFGKEKGAK